MKLAPYCLSTQDIFTNAIEKLSDYLYKVVKHSNGVSSTLALFFKEMCMRLVGGGLSNTFRLVQSLRGGKSWPP